MKNKKILLSLGTLVTIVTPIVAVVSCGENDKVSNDQSHKDGDIINGTNIDPVIEATKNKEDGDITKSTNMDTVVELTENKEVKSIYDKNLILNGKEITTDHDMWIMSDDYYKGRIDNTNTNGYTEVGVDDATPFGQEDAIMLGKGDGVIFVFDDDDSDGLSVTNFAKTHYLEDTSLPSEAVKFYKEQSGVITKSGMFGKTYLPFDKTDEYTGKLIPWFGSQTNHGSVSFEDAMTQIKKEYSPELYKQFEDYYTKASHSFVPAIISDDLITYKQIAKNAIEVVFNPQKDFSLTAALMHAIPEGQVGEPKGTKLELGPLSIGGEKEWHAYWTHHNHTLASKYTADDATGKLIS